MLAAWWYLLRGKSQKSNVEGTTLFSSCLPHSPRVNSPQTSEIQQFPPPKSPTGERARSVLLNFALMGFVTYAFVAAVASTGSRRLFWAAFAASACVSLFVGLSLGPYRPSVWLWDVIRPAEHEAAAAIRSGQRAGADTQAFDAIFRDIFVIAVATVAAYIIPWFVQRGQKPPASRVPTSP